MTSNVAKAKAESAIQLAKQAERLSLLPPNQDSEEAVASTAVEAKFITPRDPVIETSNGDRLPGVPPDEAQKLNKLKDEVDGRDSTSSTTASGGISQREQQEYVGNAQQSPSEETLDGSDHPGDQFEEPRRSLRTAASPSQTSPLFPPLPLYGPPSLLRNLQCATFRISSCFLSLGFLAVIVLGSAFTSIPLMFRHIGLRLTFRNPDARRPFHVEEERRKKLRQEEAKAWKHKRRQRRCSIKIREDSEEDAGCDEFIPTEGGRDPLVCDVSYYARRVGLDIEEFKVQTEDGFIIDLWHVYNPKEYVPVSSAKRHWRTPDIFPHGFVGDGLANGASGSQYSNGKRRYPVLMIHGLLQSSGAYCCNDDDSLAFFLCKRYEP